MRILVSLIIVLFGIKGNCQYKIIFLSDCEKKYQDSIVNLVRTYYSVDAISIVKAFPNTKKFNDGWEPESLIKKISTQDSAKRIIIVTDRKLMSYRSDGKPWTLFGYSMYNPGIVIVSTYLFGGQKVLERFKKVLVHEMTHTYGVGHCTDKNCLMNPKDGYISDLDGATLQICGKCTMDVKSWKWK